MNHTLSKLPENVVPINIMSFSAQLTSILKTKEILKCSLSLENIDTYEDMLEVITAPDGFLPALAVTADRLWIFLSKSTLGPILQRDPDTRTGYRLTGFQTNCSLLVLMNMVQVCNLITKDNILHLERLPHLNNQFVNLSHLHNDLDKQECL